MTALRCLPLLFVLACAAHKPLVAPVEPRPDDVATVDGMIRAFYDVVNIPPEAPRQWDRDRTLYVPWIRFVSINGEGAVSAVDHETFVRETEPLIATGFREQEIARVTRVYGNMVHVDSTYETVRGPGEGTRSRGVNSIELYWDGKRWWIASVVWQSESEKYPIPAELLAGSRG